MSAAAGRGAARGGRLLSIGEVLAELRPDFDDVTHSKIRFLEDQGLVEPQRTPSGYRKFTPADVERLRLVLALQRDRYLPLRVIREYLDAVDRGLEPPELPGGAPRVPRVVPPPGMPGPDRFAGPGRELRLTRAELLEAARMDAPLLEALESYGLLGPGPGGWYDADALEIATVARELGGYGIEARHLRAFRTAAEREVGLVEQVVSPLRRQRQAGSEARAAEVAREISALCVRLHASLVRSALDGHGR
ncbi:MAG: MerR family transcriptional regulator [Actinomycetota bacterium]